jgi:subtilisin
MAKGKVLAGASVLCVFLMVATCFSMAAMAGNEDQKVRVIVLFKDKVDKDLIKNNGGTIITEYSIIPGVVTELTADQIKELKKSSKVKSVEEDGQAEILGSPDAEANAKRPPKTPPELQWGVDRIDADKIWGQTTGLGVKVAVLDTGIDLDHPDLYNVKSGPDLINKDATPDDDNGHGTHCAGIIAAQHNDVGVKGVAPGVELWAVKVLNSQGSGPISVIVSGIEWAINNNMKVISMSLGGTGNDPAMEAICNAAFVAGIIVVAAAGNNAGSGVMYPGKYANVIAVAATTSRDKRASYSSFGPEVDLAAPGDGIYSTYKNGGYATMSGTSMACPHVAGTAALLLEDFSVAATRAALVDHAEDLGTSGWDKYFGNGLVDSEASYNSLLPA